MGNGGGKLDKNFLVATFVGIVAVLAPFGVSVYLSSAEPELKRNFVGYVVFTSALISFCVWSIQSLVLKKLPSLSRKLKETTEIAEGLNEHITKIKGMTKLKDITYYNDENKQVLDEFVKDDKLLSADVPDIRIIGTFLGVKENTYNLAEHFRTYFEKRKEARSDCEYPFNNLYLSVPSGKKSVDAVREFAATILISADEIYNGVKNKSIITIKFLDYQDVFPCWHLWGQTALIIIPSIGESDSTLSNTLPVAIIAFIRENSLGTTARRLSDHFDDILKDGNGSHGQEKWSLHPKNKIVISLCSTVEGEDEGFSKRVRKDSDKIEMKVEDLKKLFPQPV